MSSGFFTDSPLPKHPSWDTRPERVAEAGDRAYSVNTLAPCARSRLPMAPVLFEPLLHTWYQMDD